MTDQSRMFGARFRADRLLKSGQGVETLLGTDLAQGGPVVIKTTSAASLSPGARLRLEHEARVLQKVRSPWLIPLLALGFEADLVYLVVPHLPGATLQTRLRAGALPVRDALTVGYCLLSALHEAHVHGVLHRDVKPANLMVSDDGPLQGATLIDFGLARSGQLDPSLRDHPVGSIQYMAPEQAGLIKDEVAEYSDLYAAGLVLFECLAGRPPFHGETVGEVLRQHLTAPVPDLGHLGVAAPHALNDVLQRLLRKDPRDRYQSAEAVLADWSEICDALARGIADPLIVVGARDRRRTLADPAFIGRSDELAALDAHLGRACAGEGGLVLVEAESGGGKTRLFDELSRVAVDRGLWVLRGQGVDQTAQRPFQVFDGVVSELVARAQPDRTWTEEFRQRLGDQGGAAGAALPQLAQILRGDPALSLGPEAFGEMRTIDALGTVLDALGTEAKPALVLLDDGQWADELTIRLLLHWQRRPSLDARRPRHVLVVVAFRAEEVPAQHPLRTLPPGQHLVLEPLGAKHIQKLVESMAGAVPPEAAEVVTRLSAGSPFMASAVLRGLVETGVLVPETSGWKVEPLALAEACSSYRAAVFLARRLEQLPPDAVHLLSVGAILGREFDVKLARSLAGQSQAQAAGCLEASRRRHLVWVNGHNARCSFVHDKIREALLARLPEADRKAFHHKAALSLDASERERIYDLAYHFDAAGHSDQALPYALAAAERARRQHALAIAESQYRIAERGARAGGAAVRYRIAEGLGDVLMLRGRYDEAQAQLERAGTLAEAAMARAQIEGKLGELAFKRGDCKGASEALESALRLLGQRVPRTRAASLLWLAWEVLRQACHTWVPAWFVGRRPLDGAERELLSARLYSRLAYAYWFQKGTVPCLWAHLREMNLAEQFPPTSELAQAYSEHAPALSLIPLFRRGIAYVEKSLAIRQALGDLWGQGQSLHFYGVVLFAAARFDEAIEKCREALRLLERTGDRWEVNLARYHIGYALYRLGDLQGAVKEARLVYQAGIEIGDAQAPGISLEIMAKASGGQVQAEAIQVELGRLKEDVQRTSNLLQAEGIRLLRDGRPDEAVAVIEQSVRILKRTGLMNAYVAPARIWLATAFREALDRTPVWNVRRRRALLRRARQAARGALRLAKKFPGDLPHVWRELGLLAAIQGRECQALRCFTESLAVAERQGARDEFAQTLLAKGRVGLTLGWLDSATEVAQAEQRLREHRAGPEEGRGEPVVQPETLSLVDRFTAVLEVGRAIVGALTTEAVYAAVREGALTLLRGESCLLLQVSDGHAPDDPAPNDPNDPSAAWSRTLVKRALAAGVPLILTEGLPDTPSESAVLTGIRSALCAPVFVRGRPAACLYVAHRQVDRLFGDEERRLAQFITTLAGAALENAAGFAALTAAHEQLEQRVAARTVDLQESNERLRREVEERRRVEEALRESEERYRAVAETAAEAIITIDEAGVIVFVNRATEQIFGYTTAELLGQPLTFLMPERLHAQHRAGMAHYLTTGQRHLTWEQVHLPGRHKNGREIPLELAFWEFTQRGRRFFSSLIRDITERVQAAELRTRFLERVFSAQEEERRRLARELHDGTGQALMALLVQLHGIERAPTLRGAHAGAEKMRRIAARTLDEVRRLAIGLRPNVLDDLGLVAALERFTTEYTQAYGIPVDLHTRGLEGRLPAMIELTLYRIHQEALTNVAKHAGATLVSIVVERQAGSVQAIIEDDGRGFEVEPTLRAAGHTQHFGLHSMKERAALAHGSLAIESTPGHGTTIYVVLPLEPPPAEPSGCPLADVQSHASIPPPNGETP